MDKKIPPEQQPAAASNDGSNPTTRQRPIVTGQCAEVLEILERRRSVFNVELKLEYGITESAARVHELRGMGFNITTIPEPELNYKGRVRRRVARYVLGTPAWPAPGFLKGEAA